MQFLCCRAVTTLITELHLQSILDKFDSTLRARQRQPQLVGLADFQTVAKQYRPILISMISEEIDQPRESCCVKKAFSIQPTITCALLKAKLKRTLIMAGRHFAVLALRYQTSAVESTMILTQPLNYWPCSRPSLE